MLKLLKLAAAMSLGIVGSFALAGAVEVLHYWTSGSEAKSVAQLKKIMRDKGHVWRDFAVTGGGGDNAMSLLRSRAAAGNPPAAAQIKGPALQEWAAEGVLANLDATAKAEKWDELLPKVVADGMKYKGNYIAVPVNVHRINWIWANASVLKKSGVREMPKTWPEFFAAAEKIRKAGFIPVATGGNPWNDFTTFESVALGVGGVKFYKAALVDLDPKALSSDEMQQSLETYRKLKAYTDPGSVGRDWNIATAMVIQGKAGFQFMGDWAKGEFVAAGKRPGQDFLCAAAPGTANAYSFNIDSFAMFKLKDAVAQKAQADLAASIMGVKFQEEFNLNKGSIPVRLNMDMDKFDDCAKLSAKDFVTTSKNGNLVPSVSQSMAVRPAVESVLKDAVSNFWNNDQLSVADAIKAIAKAGATR